MQAAEQQALHQQKIAEEGVLLMERIPECRDPDVREKEQSAITSSSPVTNGVYRSSQRQKWFGHAYPLAVSADRSHPNKPRRRTK